MSDLNYLAGRKQYARPQGIMFADSPGIKTPEGFYVPSGYEVGTQGNSDNNFLILSDNNRDPISISKERIEQRRRTINGTMRSYHVADKSSISTSWNRLPSRSFALDPEFDEVTGKPQTAGMKYTTDGGAGGVELLEWYQNNKGSFWVYLSYDLYNEFSGTTNKYAHLDKYSQVLEVYFASFSYTVEKRGGSNFDFWNIDLSLEEV